jgi:hypothetical protein
LLKGKLPIYVFHVLNNIIEKVYIRRSGRPMGGYYTGNDEIIFRAVKYIFIAMYFFSFTLCDSS